MEVNAAEGDGAASSTQGEFVLVHNGHDNPDTTSVLLRSLGGRPVKAGFEYLAKVQARYLNGFTAESAVLSLRACSAPALPRGAEWSLSLISTSSTSMTIAWAEPRQAVGPAAGCQITGYRLHMSSDGGVTYSEVDAAEVRDRPNLHQHAVLATNFDLIGQSDVGSTFHFRLEAHNVAGVLSSSSLAIVLADAPAAPASGPEADPSLTNLA
jgi:hypothetical protein